VNLGLELVFVKRVIYNFYGWQMEQVVMKSGLSGCIVDQTLYIAFSYHLLMTHENPPFYNCYVEEQRLYHESSFSF
jgi:hypothetical protein